MPMQLITRRQGTVAFSSGAKVTFPLSRGNVYRHIAVRLKGAPTLTAVNNTRANTLRGDEWGVISKIEIIAGGVNVIRSYSGNDLWWLNYFTFGKYPRRTLTIGDAATANPSFDSTLIIPFDLTRSRSPVDCLLDSRSLDQLTLEVTWGTFASINSSATAWTTNPTLDVISREAFNVPQDARFATMRHAPIELAATTTSTELAQSLQVGPQYRGFIINVNAAGVDDSGKLNAVKIVSAARTYADFPTLTVWPQYMDTFYDLENTLDGNAVGAVVTYDPPQRSSSSVHDAWYFYDHVMDGMQTEAIESYGLSELKMLFDVTGAANQVIRVIPLQLWPIRQAPAR